MKAARARADGGQNYFISFNDLLVGMLFIFILLLVTYALDFRAAQQTLNGRLDRLEKRMAQRETLLRHLQGKLLAAGYKSSIDPDQGVLRLADHVLFKQGDDTLSAGAQGALTVLANELAKELPCYGKGYDERRCGPNRGPILEAVYIEGHTDSQGISTRRFPNNWYLSAARAFKTYDHLTKANKGFLKNQPNASGKAALIGASAYADTRRLEEKIDSAMNRRIDFRFLLAPASKAEIDRARDK